MSILQPANSNDIAVVMITCDRSQHNGRQNYLTGTLQSLFRSGLWRSTRLNGFDVFTSNPESNAHVSHELQTMTRFSRLHLAGQTYLACENAGRALIAGSLQMGANWVLFIEDDVEVCSDFLNSVGRWLDQHGKSDNYQLFAFGAAYSQTLVNYKRGATAWEYPVDAFYGTQCFAVRPRIASIIGSYLSQTPMIRGVRNPNAYDLMIQDVINAQFVSPMFLASCPSFVQHIGKQSICTGKPEEDVHTFISYQGSQWAYKGYYAHGTGAVIVS